MLGSDALEVAIGLILLYFLLSTICSAINEIIVGLLHYRAQTLGRGIQTMLKDEALVGALYSHPLVDTQVGPGRAATAANGAVEIGQSPARRTRMVPGWIRRSRQYRDKPSYLSSRTFALTLVDVLRDAVASPAGEEQEATSVISPPAAPQAAAAMTIPELIRVYATSENGRGTHLARVLTLLALDAEARGQRIELSIQQWFDDTMQRVSGWYKRRIQIWLILIALVVTTAVGADTLALASSLWHDNTLRESVVAVAQQTAKQGSGGSGNPVSRIVDVQSQVSSLRLPLGWAVLPHDLRSLLSRILGLLLTAAALTLGAPFWFDLLNKVANLRAAGPKPADTTQQAPATGTAAPTH